MKTTISLLLVLIFSLCALGQAKESAEYTFPPKDSEFAVVFPGKPVIAAVYVSGGVLISAELKYQSSFLKAEILNLKPKEAKEFFKKDDKEISDYPTNYAAASGLIDVKTETGTDKFGRYAKARGFKTVNGLETTVEIYFYLGKTEIITLFAAAEATEYPTAEVTRFFNSLRLDSSIGAANAGGGKSDLFAGGELNGRAVSLPKPDYPSQAKIVRASGTVAVQIEIDEDGKVVSARATGGHPSLRQAAEKAALQARFNPFNFYGQKLKVKGVVNYHFIPANSD